MSRVATGWIPNRSGGNDEDPEEYEDGDIDDVEHIPATPTPPPMPGTPMSPMGSQREATEQRRVWGIEWDVGVPRQAPQWPLVMRHQLPKLIADMCIKACQTFPDGTRLGWDSIHPKALTLLSVWTISCLVQVLFAAEWIGEWPELSGRVVVVLLPKTDGGRRPIGLILLMPRV